MTRTSTSSACAPQRTARSGCGATPASSRTRRSARHWRSQSIVICSSSSCSAARPTSATITSSLRSTRSSIRSVPQRRATSRRRSHCSPKRAPPASRPCCMPACAGDPRSGGARPEPGERSRHQARGRDGEPRHVLRSAMVPGGAGRSAVLGCGRARHRRLRPPGHARRVSQRRARQQRHLELVAVHDPTFDGYFKDYQSAVGVDAQKAACKNIETILNDECPVVVPYFYNYLSGHTKGFTGVLERPRPDVPRQGREDG